MVPSWWRPAGGRRPAGVVRALRLGTLLALLAPVSCAEEPEPPPLPPPATSRRGDPLATQLRVIGVVELHPTVRETIGHPTDAFTQGLVVGGPGLAYESRGGYGTSSVAAIDTTTGAVVDKAALDHDVFGEGLAIVGGDLVQLTWKERVAIVYAVDPLREVRRIPFDAEGWGLCFDGARLVASDGSDQLTFRNPESLDRLATVTVRADGTPVDQLNELECTPDAVWANVWHSDTLVRIDPTNGDITGFVELTALGPDDTGADDVLNGIAYDPTTDTYWVTGKNWPSMYRIALDERSVHASRGARTDASDHAEREP